MNTIATIEAILSLIYEAWAKIHDKEKERFDAEWKIDQDKLRAALAAGDAVALNALNAKYSKPLGG